MEERKCPKSELANQAEKAHLRGWTKCFQSNVGKKEPLSKLEKIFWKKFFSPDSVSKFLTKGVFVICQVLNRKNYKHNHEGNQEGQIYLLPRPRIFARFRQAYVGRESKCLALPAPWVPL